MKHNYTTTSEMVQAFEVTENNENHDFCKSCGGSCCKNMGCEIYPQDVLRWFNSTEITNEMIEKILDSGMVTLDWWEGDVRVDVFKYPEEMLPESEELDRVYYLHMRCEGDLAVVYPSYGGQCRALGENGCTIEWEMRPTGGKALVPDPDPKSCDSEVSKPECCLSWIPYQSILEEVAEKYDEPVDFSATNSGIIFDNIIDEAISDSIETFASRYMGIL